MDATDPYDAVGGRMVEGVARVIRVDAGTVWLEPDSTDGCGGCSAAAKCGSAGKLRLGRVSRRFPLPNDFNAAPGERVVVGIPKDALVRASFTAYAIPLVTMVAAGLWGDSRGWGDGATGLAAMAGLVAGMGLAHLRANLLARRGDLSPRFIRRAWMEQAPDACRQPNIR